MPWCWLACIWLWNKGFNAHDLHQPSYSSSPYLPAIVLIKVILQLSLPHEGIFEIQFIKVRGGPQISGQ